MKVSVVVPCYRSAATLPQLVAPLLDILQTTCEAAEILLVVDGSPDETWEVAKKLAVKNPDVRAVQLSRNYGQHNALMAGVRLARYETTVTMDDDLQHLPSEIPRLLAELREDTDLVYGVPREEEHNVLRSLASRSVKATMSKALRVDSARDISAFRAFRTYLREGFEGVHGPHASIDVALSWATTRVRSIDVSMNQRQIGQSNYTARALLRHTANMILGYSTLPLRLVSLLGAACALLGAALLVVIIWKFITGETTVAGFTTIASMIALFSGAQMLAIGVLGEYVGRVHAHNMGRPTYVVRDVVD